jgi:predicted lipoprotein with Yx(FWY)xxD motif
MTWNSDAADTELSPQPIGSEMVTNAHLRMALTGVIVVAIASLAAACGSGGAASDYAGGQPAGAGTRPAATRGPVVAVRKVTGVGTVLVDRSGKTIYSPQQEAQGKVLCTGSCLGFWFPVSVNAGAPLRVPPGVSGVLGTIHRGDDGVTQITFDGTPLYTFRLDQGPGQVHGNNFSDAFGGTSFTWHVVAASGGAPRPVQSAKPGGGYSYPAGGAYG